MDIKLPKNQVIKERHLDVNRNLVAIITCDIVKNKWYMYSVSPTGEVTLIKTGSSPNKLENVDVNSRKGGKQK